jgi:hypothetical protein
MARPKSLVACYRKTLTMTTSRPLLVFHWILTLCTAAGTAYLGVRNAELEKQYAALAAAVDAPGKGGGRDAGDGSRSWQRELRALQMRVGAMQRGFEEWTAKVRTLQTAAETAPLPGEQGARARKRPLTDAEIQETTQRQRERNSARLRDYFQVEPADAAWSQQTTDLIKNRFADTEELAKTPILAAECRSTLCRVEVSHEDSGRQAEFEATLPMLFGGELPRTMMFAEEQPDGSIRQTVYLARDGHGFP